MSAHSTKSVYVHVPFLTNQFACVFGSHFMNPAERSNQGDVPLILTKYRNLFNPAYKYFIGNISRTICPFLRESGLVPSRWFLWPVVSFKFGRRHPVYPSLREDLYSSIWSRISWNVQPREPWGCLVTGVMLRKREVSSWCQALALEYNFYIHPFWYDYYRLIREAWHVHVLRPDM